jgi:hypothetical protein
MKYTCEITINLPREEVIRKLNNVENMKHWQKGLINYEILSGIPGEVGATMKLDYKMGKRTISMIETISKNDFPNEFNATYEAKGVYNIQRNTFHEVDSNTTKWVSESEFKFSSFGMKLMGWIMPGVFKKQSLKYLEDFKNYVENGVSIHENSQ